MVKDGKVDILVQEVYKSYGRVKALDGIDLAVSSGSIFALLGPNGAGKTTLIRILTTLLSPDKGVAKVAGYDVVDEAAKLRPVIGLAGQYAAVDENLSGKENLEMVGRLYHLSRSVAKHRADELLSRFDLSDAAGRRAKTYSGGMRRRLDLAASLLGDPQVLFLDEPTTGLDPRGRFGMWEIIKNLSQEGRTILLTTQYLEEADQLADHIALIDHGKVIAEGTPSELKAKVGGDVLEVHLQNRSMLERAIDSITSLGMGEPEVDSQEYRLRLPVEEVSLLADVIRRLDSAKIPIVDIALRRPSLDEVFLSLTGHAAEGKGPVPPGENL